MKKCLSLLLAALFCGCCLFASAEAARDIAAEGEAFLATLKAEGYAEVGAYKVEQIKDGVYHMDEATKALPGGATDENGNTNNPSSIYFVEIGDEILIVDNGNPASGEAETDAKVIMEAMTAGKPVTMVFTHSHFDHTGLARSTAVFENVNVQKVYIGEPDVTSASEAIAQFMDKVEPLKDGDSFTVGGDSFTANIVSAHTDGSLMITDSTREILFTGDTFGSGFVWLFWQPTEGDPLTNISGGLSRAREILNGMQAPTILAGHRWQQFWEDNPQRPNEMSIQYFNDMAQVISGLTNGTTLKEEYSFWQDGIELSANGSKAKVDTLPTFVDAYLDATNKMDAAYIYSATHTLSIETIDNVAAPCFVVFPDKALTDEEALALLQSTGISEIVDRSAATAYVARPANGESFTEADLDTFYAIAGRIVVTENLKLVGFGSGATFINQHLAKYANIMAGIASIGGEPGAELSAGVPAYISGNLDAATPYIAADKAEKVSEDGDITTYCNPGSRFEIVVTNAAEEDEATAFQNAWNLVLNKFGRIGNYIEEAGAVGTWYSRPIITGNEEADTTRKYQFFDSIECIDNVTRYVVTEDLNGSGTLSLWYEYIPDEVVNAEAGTVPVIFLMHGNTNDPRTQYDCSGWATLAAKEGIILVCPEWQGHTYQGYTYEPMTNDANATPEADFVKVVGKVLEKYPQADASRVYISGLSAGSRNTYDNGIANPKYFAAGAGQSGPFGASEDQMALAASNAAQYDFPIIFFSGDKDEYLMSSFDKVEVTPAVTVLQAFETMNDMPVTQLEDLTEDMIDLYAVPWTETYTVEANAERVATMIGGSIKNDAGVEIAMYRIYGWGHWNYAPDVELMWNFMKKYSRDPETGALTISE